MAGPVHLLTTFQGGYVGARLVQETWQFGVRWRLSDAPADPVGSLPTDWQPVATTVNRTETNWDITGNWKMAGPLLNEFDIDDWLNDQVAPAITTLINSAYFSSTVELLRVNVYPIGSDGKAIPAPPYAGGSPVTLTWHANATPNGTGNSNNVPLQVSSVASFRTQQVGRRGRGRIYLPAIAATDVATGGFYSTAKVEVMPELVAQFLTDAHISLGGATERHVDPIVTGAPYSEYAAINEVRVGDVLDTQRRRRKSIQEVWYSSPFPVEE